MKKLNTFLVGVLALGLTATATAGTESGLYIGGSIGSSDLSADGDDPTIGDWEVDDDATGYKAFVGYNFGIIPLLDLSVEGSYIDFGSFEGDSTFGSDEADVDALSVAGLVALTFGPIGVFGKAGYYDWNTDFDGIDDGSDPLYGVGAKFALGSLSIRAEYEMCDLEEGDLDFYSVGLAYTF